MSSEPPVLDLASNLHPHGPHPAVVEAARSAVLDRYPEPNADLDPSSLRWQVATEIGVSRDQVLITAGATEAIHLALRAVLGPDDACTVFTPAFGEYERAALASGFKVERHEASPPDFAPPDDPPRALLTLVANPSSPAGVYVDEATVRRVLRVARGVLLVDAVYEPFVEDAWDANKLVRDGLPVLVVHSFTKLHAIPGLRIGYVAGPAPLIARLAALQPAWAVGAPAIEAARAALLLAAERREVVREVAATREAMHEFFAARGTVVSPARANFVLAQVGDARAVRGALLGRGIEVRDCASFGLPEWVRIATPATAELPRLLDALDAALDGLASVLMVVGTASSVGKSVVVAALCRIFRQDGVRVAPFKAQNMSNNAAVTADGLEIGRAQAEQAAAAGLEPHVDMNPVLLKPQGDRTSQLVLRGRPAGLLRSRDFVGRKRDLWPDAAEALDSLRARYDLVVAEGAGSPSEPNLRAGDITNMRVARHAQAPTLLVGDIDRGGVFAHLLGTLELLPPEDRALVRGLVINRFRGDPSLLGPAIEELEQRTGVPVLGVIPWIDDIGVAEEDAVALERPEAGAAEADATEVDVAVVRLPRIANFDDFDPLIREPGVRVRWVLGADELGEPDLAVLPGTKATVADLEWLRGQGLDAAIGEHAARGGAVLGVCGGFQMLGTRLVDEEGVEAAPGTSTPGLGLLPVETRFVAAKTTRQASGEVRASVGPWAGASGLPVSGYEIHMGQHAGEGDARPLLTLDGRPDGAVSPDGRIAGTYLHGLLHNDGVRAALLRALGRREQAEVGVAFAERREEAFDRLAAVVREHLDMGRVNALLGR